MSSKATYNIKGTSQMKNILQLKKFWWKPKDVSGAAYSVEKKGNKIISPMISIK